MAQANVDLLRRMLELAESGDLAASTALFDEDVEVRDLSHLPDTPEIMRGRAAILDNWRKWFEHLDDWTVEVSEYVDADPWIVCATRWTATGKGSDVPVEWRVADGYEVEGGKIVRVTWGYADIAAALEDLGLVGAGERVSLDAPVTARIRDRRARPRS